jgi:hypothetical protein
LTSLLLVAVELVELAIMRPQTEGVPAVALVALTEVKFL